MNQSEAETRKEIIDKNLKKAGWNVGDLSQVIQEYDIEVDSSSGSVKDSTNLYSGHQFSDYVLLGKDGKPLAVIEAKKTSKDAELGQEQAKQYCYNIKKRYQCELPFCFYTNGHDSYFWDLDNYPPVKIFGFPTRDDLERFRFIQNNQKPLATEMINTVIAGRDYQLKAIRSVMESIEEKRRTFLLVMATGSGKTRTCIALADALMRASRVERVLFLVDRIALRNQALDSFKEHLPEEPRWPKVGEKAISKDRRIYVSTYQSMFNILRDEEVHFSPHFFDLVIVDESHRSIYNVYKEVLDYFNAITVGLTATPTNIIDHNTFKLFNCEDGLPTFVFSYEEAVNHVPPYLCTFQAMKIMSKFQKEGISKRTISLEDQLQLFTDGGEIEEVNYEGKDIEKTVINKGTNTLIVKEFMEESIKDPNGVLPGKSIFFCMTKSHARRIAEIFNALYPQYKGELARVIVSDDPRVHGKGGLIDQFTNNDMPRIAISVDMLDTGIDVREVVNLVFAKPVYSYTKFWQMIGRGTRLLDEEKIQAWCPEKEVFLILDCWDNFEYFKINPEGKTLKLQVPLPVRYAGLRIEKIAKAIELNNSQIAEKEIALFKEDLKLLPEKSIVVMEKKSELVKLDDENFWLALTPEKTAFLSNTIKSLFRSVSQVDFKAMRFKKDVVETSLALLTGDKEMFDCLKGELVEIISELPLTIDKVAEKKELISRVQTNAYWAAIDDAVLDELAADLAPLMKHRETVQNPGLSTYDFTDSIISRETVRFGPENEAISVSKYREMVEAKINELTEKNPILQKIRDGEHITESDAETLADLLHDEQPYITLDLLRKVYQNKKAQFVQFIKHILGIEILESFPETVSKSIDQFITEHTSLTSQQLHFLNILRDYIIDKGDIAKKDLIQSPFTIIHPDGIRGIFTPKEIEEILLLTDNLVA